MITQIRDSDRRTLFSEEKLYYKDGKYMVVGTSLDTNYLYSDFLPKSISYKAYYSDNGKIGNYYFYYEDYIKDGTINYEERDEIFGPQYQLRTYSSMKEGVDSLGLLLSNPLRTTLFSKMSIEEFDGIKCYKIELNDDGEEIVLLFEKETGLLRKYNDEEYYYTFNTVSDVVFEVPDDSNVVKKDRGW